MGDARPSWEQIVTQKRSARDLLLAPYSVNDVGSRVPRAHQVEERAALDEDVRRITDVDSIPVLLEKIENGELAAEQIVTAYIRRYEEDFKDSGIYERLTLCRAVVAHQLVSSSPRLGAMANDMR